MRIWVEKNQNRTKVLSNQESICLLLAIQFVNDYDKSYPNLPEALWGSKRNQKGRNQFVLDYTFPYIHRPGNLLHPTRVNLESLEDAYILRGNDDSLSDKHGCPAYVSPEILNTNGSYSGKAADVWSLGVMLYTMLVGRYPFHDIEPSSLFSKIRRGQFSIPETLSPKAKCLIRSILRRDPSERLTSQEILDHPWFSTDFNVSNSGYGAKEVTDQLVPDVNMEEDLDPFFN
ncbi:UNVERIFIED_CONTAM: Tribbles 2 [Gekko kuhli]